MRLVRALLFVTLTGSLALADEAPPPAAEAKPAETTESAPAPAKPVKTGKVPLRVVKMLPETHQVLLYDKNRGTHVVAEAGQDIDGYIVDDIDEDEVTLVAPSGAEVILTAPDMSWRRRAAERKAAAAKAAAATSNAPAAVPADGASTGPVDPYADAAAADTTSGAPADPYGDDPAVATSTGPVRVTSAGGTATAPASVPAPAAPSPTPAAATPAATPSTAAATPSAAAATPPTAAPAPAATPAASAATAQPAATDLAAAVTGAPTSDAPTTRAPSPATFTLSRSEVDAALSDFGATAVTFDARFTGEGLRLDSIAPGTILAKAGLQKGDTITAVDGKPLRSFDDAASLYAHMGRARGATVQVLRAGTPVTLRVAIR